MSVPTEPAWTIGRLLTWTADFLARRGSESPRLDAEVLLAWVLTYQRVQLYTHFEAEVGDQARARYRDLVRRRAEGMPVAYLVGRKEFFSLDLHVSPAVLIPRPDSEFVVMELLDWARSIDTPRVVDVGTGSGNLALAVAKHHPTTRVAAIDLSPAALAVARANAQRLGIAERVEWIEGDLLGGLPPEFQPDAIISNPPYIATADIAGLPPGVRDYEPRLALDGGPSGLEVVERLAEQARARLRPGGRLILEIGAPQEPGVRGLLERSGAWSLMPTVRDYAGHPRVIHALRVAEPGVV